jgi:hypothetical protein
MIMKKIIIKQSLLLVMVSGVLLSACYKKFDPKSYQPAFTINGYTSVAEIGAGSLVGYWAFDGSYIDSVSKTIATSTGTSFTGGFKKQSVDFNVANKSFVTTPSSNAIKNMGSFTISFWANPTFVDENNNGEIDGILGFVNLARTDDFWGNIDWFVENGSTTSAATIKVHVVGGTKDTWLVMDKIGNLFGKWSNHTLTYDAASSTLTYYINGTVIGSTATAWTGAIQFPSPGSLAFGTVQFMTTPSLTTTHGAEPWASYLTGQMDEIRIYNKALTASDLQALMVLQGKGK